MFPKALLALAIASPLIVTNEFHIPQKYRGDTTALVYFTDQKTIDKNCGKQADPRLYTVACAYQKRMTMYLPNPCKDKDADKPESYAHVLCHEIGHLNGWHHINE